MVAPSPTNQSMYGNINYQNNQCMKEIVIFISEQKLKENSEFPDKIYQKTPEAEAAFADILVTAPLYVAAV